jgi:PAS domain S-box-containing protein
MKDMFLEVLPNPVIIYDSQWKISKINESAVQQLGYLKAEELIGRSIHSILPDSESHVADDLSQALQKERKEFYIQPIKHLGKDGKQVKILSQFRMVENMQNSETYKYIESGFLLEEALQQNERQLKKLNYYKILAENVPGLIMLLVDESLEIQCSVGGKPLVTDKTNNLVNRLPQGFIEVLQPLLKIAFDGTSVSREFKYGTHFYSVRLTPLLNHEGGDLCVIILQNITETKIVENKLKISKEEAEAANEAKSNFIAKMSHEIRTPLNAIIGFTDQLGKTKLTKKQSTYMDVVNNSSQHLLSIIDDILVLSRIESGQVEVDEEPFRIATVIKAVNDVLDLRVREKNLTFQMHCNPAINEVLLGDPAKIRQVLINLIGNAIKFTHKGIISLSCSTLSRTNKKLTLRFDVSDSGIGIPANDIERIFEPFQQVDNGVGRSYFGSGLGLTISNDLVKSMGGVISVKSTPSEGSIFSFALTFKRSNIQLAEYEHNTFILPDAPLGHVSILFVDDDPVSRMLGKVILDQYKAKCTFVSSGDEAIKKFKPGRFQIVLLDINMPGISGVDVARNIRKIEGVNKKHPQARIIAMTANVLKMHIKQYLKAGMDDYILKPFREADLLEKIIAHSTYKDSQKPEITGSTRPVRADYKLDELLRITNGDKDYTLLMLETFIDNGKNLLDRIRKANEQGDYESIAEAAHRLLPSVGQLGFGKATALLKRIDYRYLRKSSFQKDPELIQHAMDEIALCIDKISKARDEFL